MSTPDIPLPLPAPGAASAELAFAQGMAAALRGLHEHGGGDPALSEAVADLSVRVCLAVQDGAACLELEDEALEVPPLAELRRSPVIADDSAGPPHAPLVLRGTRLYLFRYWRYERELASGLRALNHERPGLDDGAVRATLDALFAGLQPVTPDHQKLAAATAVARGLCVISGGPGTGKTTTVLRILAALLQLQPGLRIAIAAPTGKAAARLQESIREQAQKLALPAAVREQLPQEAHTVHRLIGLRPERAAPRHGPERPLPYHVVVVDEASMLDLALAAKLVAALPVDARLILLGDKDQLAAVEAGAVYAELSATRALDPAWARRLSALSGQPAVALGDPAAPLANAVNWLGHNYRFGADSGIGRLARAINAGDADHARALLESGVADLGYHPALPVPELLARELAAGYAPLVEAVRLRRRAAEVLRALERYRVLCATRTGSLGCLALAQRLNQEVARQLGESAAGNRWYAGRAVMVTGNDYGLRLYNGDIGVALPDAEGRLQVHFASADGSTRALAPGRLGALESALALTVHKSQGSEFERVDLVVDPAVPRGLSRELLYTGLTRARAAARLWCPPELLAAGIEQRLLRRSTLLD